MRSVQVCVPTELGTNKCVPYRQDGNPTELGTNKCVPYRQDGIHIELGTNKCVPYRQEKKLDKKTNK